MRKKHIFTFPDGTIKVTGRRMYNSVVMTVSTEEEPDVIVGMFMSPTQFEMFCEQIEDLYAGYQKMDQTLKGQA